MRRYVRRWRPYRRPPPSAAPATVYREVVEEQRPDPYALDRFAADPGPPPPPPEPAPWARTVWFWLLLLGIVVVVLVALLLAANTR